MNKMNDIRDDVESSFSDFTQDEIAEIANLIFGCFGETSEEKVADLPDNSNFLTIRSSIVRQNNLVSYNHDQLLKIFHEKFHLIRSKKEQDPDFINYITCFGLVLFSQFRSCYLSKDISELLLHGNLHRLALRFAEMGRVGFEAQHYTQLFSDESCRIVYSLFVRHQSECYGACGDYVNAIDLYIKSAALDPNVCDYRPIEDWSRKSSECPTVSSVTHSVGLDFQKLIFHTTNIYVKSDTTPLDVLFSKELPSIDLSSPRYIGDVKDEFPSLSQAYKASIRRINHAKIYTDYWKTAVITKSDFTQQTVSSGPHELVYVANKTGFGPSFDRFEGTAALVAARHSWIEYYHWLIDIMPRMHLLLESGAKFDRLIAHGSKTRAYCAEFFELVNISTDRVMGDMSPIAIQAETTLIPDRGCHINHSYIDFMKDIYIKNARDVRIKSRKIFISRQAAKDRKFTHFDKIEEVLRKKGFEIVQLESMKLQEQAQIMSEADVILAPHGAGLSNIIFCKPGTRVYEFIGHGSPLCFRYLSQICKLNYTAIHTEWHGTDLTPSMDYFMKVMNEI